MTKKRSLDVARLISDLGGPGFISKLTGLPRGNLYSSQRRNRLTSDQLASLLAGYPTLDLRKYIIEEE